MLRLLVPIDVAARGLDMKDAGIMVNYDMQVGNNGAEDYIHRIGRMGRAGAKGKAFTFFTQGDTKLATDLVNVLMNAEQEIPDKLRCTVQPKVHPGNRQGGFGRVGGFSGGRGGWSGYMLGGMEGFGHGRRGGGHAFGRHYWPIITSVCKQHWDF
jgi:ATP-dependent RNA helicase DDX5/DBP2